MVSNIHVQEALRDQALITYQKTVLGALQDVENALIAFSKEQQHRKVLNDAVVFNGKAVDLSLQLYAGGQTDFLNVLNAQRSLYSSQDALVQSERSIVTISSPFTRPWAVGGKSCRKPITHTKMQNDNRSCDSFVPVGR